TRVDDKESEECSEAKRRADHIELLLRPAEPSLADPHRERHRLGLSGLELLQRSLDLLAPRLLRVARGGGPHHRRRPRDLLLALLAFLTAREHRIDEYPSDAADRDAHQKEQGDRVHAAFDPCFS